MNTLKLILLGMRPAQWTKNLVIFLGLIFAGQLRNINSVMTSVIAFFIFSFVSGSIYLLNDIFDIERDKLHFKKCNRPIASAKLRVKTAIISASIILVIILPLSFLINRYFGMLTTGYVLLNILYNIVFKHIFIIDVISISFGFLIRIVAGVIIFGAEVSSWLLICTSLLALFLALAKRKVELAELTINPVRRKTLALYTPKLLDEMILIVTAATLLSYMIYTISPETISKFHTKNLMVTIPFVLYGIFRYLYLINEKQIGENPELVLFQDKPLLITIILWIVSVIIILYFSH